MSRVLFSILLLAILGKSVLAASIQRWDRPRPGIEAELPRRDSLSLKAKLSCESDMNVTPDNTLQLNQGDLAGVILQLPTPSTPYRIRTVTLGLHDLGVPLPADLTLLVYQANGSVYDYVAGFTYTHDFRTTHAYVNLGPFRVDVTDEFLFLYGQDPASGPPQIFPAGDASPHCAPASTCSVIAREGEGFFDDYGRFNGVDCPSAPSNFEHLDIVAEIDVVETALPVQTGSWAALKARY